MVAGVVLITVAGAVTTYENETLIAVATETVSSWPSKVGAGKVKAKVVAAPSKITAMTPAATVAEPPEVTSWVVPIHSVESGVLQVMEDCTKGINSAPVRGSTAAGSAEMA